MRLEDEVKMRVEWSRVLEVFAFDRCDPLADDREICVGFRYGEDGSCWWVSEEAFAYRKLLEVLPEKFPGIRDSWRRELTFPLVPPKRLTLWGEPLSAEKS